MPKLLTGMKETQASTASSSRVESLSRTHSNNVIVVLRATWKLQSAAMDTACVLVDRTNYKTKLDEFENLIEKIQTTNVQQQDLGQRKKPPSALFPFKAHHGQASICSFDTSKPAFVAFANDG